MRVDFGRLLEQSDRITSKDGNVDTVDLIRADFAPIPDDPLFMAALTVCNTLTRPQ